MACFYASEERRFRVATFVWGGAPYASAAAIRKFRLEWRVDMGYRECIVGKMRADRSYASEEREFRSVFSP